ncbi:MAG: hypothetical protein ACK4IS_13290 [Erythrobacter sp.]
MVRVLVVAASLLLAGCDLIQGDAEEMATLANRPGDARCTTEPHPFEPGKTWQSCPPEIGPLDIYEEAYTPEQVDGAPVPQR